MQFSLISGTVIPREVHEYSVWPSSSAREKKYNLRATHQTRSFARSQKVSMYLISSQRRLSLLVVTTLVALLLPLEGFPDADGNDHERQADCEIYLQSPRLKISATVFPMDYIGAHERLYRKNIKSLVGNFRRDGNRIILH